MTIWRDKYRTRGEKKQDRIDEEGESDLERKRDGERGRAVAGGEEEESGCIVSVGGSHA